MAYSDTGKRPVKYRKTISPELTAGTAFDGVQPGDLVKVHLKGSKTVLSPVFIIDVQETPGGRPHGYRRCQRRRCEEARRR